MQITMVPPPVDHMINRTRDQVTVSVSVDPTLNPENTTSNSKGWDQALNQPDGDDDRRWLTRNPHE
jgi:hypothetical protein